MTKAIFIDTSICTACRACQVACKQWHDLPAEQTINRGSFQNPPDLSFTTYKVVRMNEVEIDGQLKWLFFPEQCRHCVEAPCLEVAMDPEAIFRDELTGAVLYTKATDYLDEEELRAVCPYDIPRKAEDGTLAKCDFCADRVHNGLEPACVKACPTGAMKFGDRDEIVEAAKQRLAVVQKTRPGARLIDPDEVNVIHLIEYEPQHYQTLARLPRRKEAAAVAMTRKEAFRKLAGPFSRAISQLG